MRSVIAGFNCTKKSKTLIFGNPGSVIKPLILNGDEIEIVTKWRYLGTTIVSGKYLSFSAKSELRAFYCSANSLVSAKAKPDEMVLMSLLFTICVPITILAINISTALKCHNLLNCNRREMIFFPKFASLKNLSNETELVPVSLFV